MLNSFQIYIQRLILAGLLICPALVSLPKLAQASAWSRPAADQSTNQEHLAVLFLLDDSGSMEKSDPDNLRYTAARLFIATMDPGDAVGAIRFATTSQPVTNEMTILADTDQKKHLIQLLSPVKPEGYTDVKAAFEQAAILLKRADLVGYRRVIVLLTDGRPEISQPYPEYEEQALDAAQNLDVPIFEVALTRAGQSAFLTRLAQLTGGQVVLAQSANDLVDSYLQILGELKDRTLMGQGTITAPDETSIPLNPALAPYIDAITFVVSKSPETTIELLAPDGSEINPGQAQVSFSMLTDPSFAAFTIQRPAGGDWTVQLTGKGEAQVRAILHSRLRARFSSPQPLMEAGQPMPVIVSLWEETDGRTLKIIGEASFSATVTRPDGSQESLDRFYDDGTHGDQLAGDGNFTRLYVNTNLPGRYRLEVHGHKGVVLVNATGYVEMLALPGVVIDQPAKSAYQVRKDPLPLQIHLQDGANLDAWEGGFQARITAPDGQIENLVLKQQGAEFSGRFLPAQNGVYQIRFEPLDAYYQGIPYQHHTELTTTVIVVAQASVENIRFGTAISGSPVRFERQQVIQGGIPLTFTIHLNAAQDITFVPELNSLPEFTLAESGSLDVPAQTDITFTLHLVAQNNLRTGTRQGQVLLRTQDTVDLRNGIIPLRFEIFNPTLRLNIQSDALVNGNDCLSKTLTTLNISTQFDGLQVETLQVYLDGIPGARLDQDQIQIRPGQDTIALQAITNHPLPAGNYVGEIRFSGMRSGVQLEPGARLPVTFSVPPVWVQCKKPMILSGWIFLLSVILIARTVRKAQSRSQPPNVSGTLYIWDRRTPGQVTTHDLTAIKKAVVKIGKGGNNDIILPDNTLEEEHLLITAERLPGGEIRQLLHPKGEIHRGYRKYDTPLPLEKDVEYSIGNLSFRYVPDLLF